MTVATAALRDTAQAAPPPPATAPPPALAHGTTPAGWPLRGLAAATTAHLALFTLLFMLLRPHALSPPPDGMVIALVREPASAAAAATPAPPVPPAPATPANPSPPLPPPPAPPAPQLPQAPTASTLPPPPPLPPQPPPLRRMARPAKPAPARPSTPAAPTIRAARTASSAARAASAPTPTVPAQPDPNSDNPPPDYPQIARDLGQQGQVLLSIRVTPNGTAAAVTVTRSSGFQILDQAARDAVLRWHFHPALTAGGPATSVLPFWISFRLQ